MTNKCRQATPAFLEQTQGARRILIVEVAGLGDLVHSLPAIWAVRRSYPSAELHCLVQTHNASLLRLTPWIDRVLPYDRGGVENIAHYMRMFFLLRAQRYDVVINLTSSDHACAIGWLSGAKRHLVRKANDGKGPFSWRLGTDIVEYQSGVEPMYQQCWHCVRQAGIVTESAEFRIERASQGLRDLGLDFAPGAARQAYLHVSPYTKLARKELPPEQMVSLLERLRKELPHLRLVLSCGTRAREREGLAELLARLSFAPWKVFCGTLNIPQLCTLIGNAALHLSGDSGSMHLAWLMGTPSVSWFSWSPNYREWVPKGEQHAVVISSAGPSGYLYGVDTDVVIAHAKKMSNLPTTLLSAASF